MRKLFFISFLLLITLWGCRDDGRKNLHTKRISNYKLQRNLASEDLVDHKDVLSGDAVAKTPKSSDKPQDIDAIYVLENNTVTTEDLDDVIGDFKQEDTNGVVVTHSPVTRKPAPPTPKTPTTTTQTPKPPNPPPKPQTPTTTTQTPNPPPNPNPPTNPTPRVTLRQAHQFTVRATLPRNPNTDVDIIWYLDNSGSMGDSIHQVKTNIVNFVRSVQQRKLNPKVIIISCIEDKQIQDWGSLTEKDGKTKIHCLSRSDVTRLESNPHTSVIHRKWGHKTQPNIKGVEYIVDSRYMATVLASESVKLAGQRKLRTSSKKVFVIVSDEDAHPATHEGGKFPQSSSNTYQGFTPPINRVFGKPNVRFFSFSAIRPGSLDYSHVIIPTNKGGVPGNQSTNSRKYVKSRLQSFEDYLANRRAKPLPFTFFLTPQAVSSCAAGYSQVYDYLADYYGGNTFDVCQSSWSNHFSKLTNHVVSATINRRVPLPTHAYGKNLRVIRAEMTDNRVTSSLSSSHYTITHNSIIIKKTYQGPTTTVEFDLSYFP